MNTKILHARPPAREQNFAAGLARHSIENNFDVLPLIGARKKITAHEMEIFLTADEEEFAEEFLAKNKLSRKKNPRRPRRFPAARKICR